jgi:uncharacterized protein (DUF736 family)
MMMVGTHIDCCVSNCVQAAVIPNVNKSEDAQPVNRVMTHVIKNSVDWSMMDGTSNRENASFALAAAEFVPCRLCANLGGNGVIDGNFFALIWTSTD